MKDLAESLVGDKPNCKSQRDTPFEADGHKLTLALNRIMDSIDFL